MLHTPKPQDSSVLSVLTDDTGVRDARQLLTALAGKSSEQHSGNDAVENGFCLLPESNFIFQYQKRPSRIGTIMNTMNTMDTTNLTYYPEGRRSQALCVPSQ